MVRGEEVKVAWRFRTIRNAWAIKHDTHFPIPFTLAKNQTCQTFEAGYFSSVFATPKTWDSWLWAYLGGLQKSRRSCLCREIPTIKDVCGNCKDC